MGRELDTPERWLSRILKNKDKLSILRELYSHGYERGVAAQAEKQADTRIFVMRAAYLKDLCECRECKIVREQADAIIATSKDAHVG